MEAEYPANKYGIFPLLSYCVTTVALLVLCYELLLHPLRNYPGPFIAKLTNGYGGFYAWKRSLHAVTWRDHLTYGRVIRQGPNKLVFNSSTALKDIYHNERVTKPVTYLANQASPGSHNTWNALDRDMHRQKRRLIGPAVNERSMKAFEPVMIEQVNVFLKQIFVNQGQPIDMKSRCNYLGMDIVSLLSFGFDLQSQTDKKNRFLADNLAIGNRRLNTYMQIPTIAKYRLQTFLNLILHRTREKVLRLVETMIKSRMKESQGTKHDFYSFVADTLKPEANGNIRVQDLWMEAILFIVAGGDTTSTAIAATLFYVARHRECYEKLAKEIRTTFRNGREIGSAKISGCTYLRACVDEALRMSPPIPGTLWRQLSPDHNGDTQLIVDGHVIPKGTYVGVNTYALHHNPDYFPDPFTYKPERWLEPENEEGAPGSWKAMHDAFIPFSTGPRGCAGKSMAYLEISLVLAKTLWYLDFKPAPGSRGNVGLSNQGEFHLYDVYLSTHDGPWLVFTPRNTLVEDFPDIEEEVVHPY